MIRSIDEFLAAWQYEASVTQRMFDALTDASLAQPVAADHRTLGRIAWHIVQTIPEMMGHTGLRVAGPGESDAVPQRAVEIADAYRVSAASLAEQLKATWTDATLSQTDAMYGEQWSRATTLGVILSHQTHHRGQLTVLMRQAGLTVPGVYGPAREEWAGMGMEPPAI